VGAAAGFYYMIHGLAGEKRGKDDDQG